MRQVPTAARPAACETPRKLLLAAMIALAVVAAPARAAQPSRRPPRKKPAKKKRPRGQRPQHGRARFNFGLLAGTLVYFLRSPFAKYLADRGQQIRSDLVTAAEMKRTAARRSKTSTAG